MMKGTVERLALIVQVEKQSSVLYDFVSERGV